MPKIQRKSRSQIEASSLSLLKAIFVIEVLGGYAQFNPCAAKRSPCILPPFFAVNFANH
jgi:hypothetical protein